MKTLFLLLSIGFMISTYGQTYMFINEHAITPESPVSPEDVVSITLTGYFSDTGGMVEDHEVSLEGTTVNLEINANSDGGIEVLTPFEITYELGSYDVGEYTVDISGTGIMTALEGPLYFEVIDSSIVTDSVGVAGLYVQDKTFDINIYPNPSSGLFQVHLPEWRENMKVEVISSQSKTVRSEMINSEITNIDLSDLEAGIYVVRIFDTFGAAIRTERVMLIQ